MTAVDETRTSNCWQLIPSAMQYDITGHKVEFPHRAYGVQLAFISKVIKTLDSKENALLEAPTGKLQI